MSLFLKHKIAIAFFFTLVFIGKTSETKACAGAGMTQYFPLATNNSGQLWVLSVTSVRHEFGSFFDCQGHLILTNSNLEKLDSVFVFEKKDSYNLEITQEDELAAFQAQPLKLIDSVYHLGVLKLKSIHPKLNWLTLIGYSLDGEYGSGPLQITRTQQIYNRTDSTRYQRRDTVYHYKDTVKRIASIKCEKLISTEPILKTFGGNLEEDYGLNPNEAIISSTRLYKTYNQKYILMMHINIMGYFGKHDAVWNECAQIADDISQESINQPLSWHHSGNDYFVFLP